LKRIGDEHGMVGKRIYYPTEGRKIKNKNFYHQAILIINIYKGKK